MIAPTMLANRRRRTRRRDDRLTDRATGHWAGVAERNALVPAVSVPPQTRVQRPVPAPSTAELAECACPDFCERDHDND